MLVYDVEVIRGGLDLQGDFNTPEVLKNAVGLFDNVLCYVDHAHIKSAAQNDIPACSIVQGKHRPVGRICNPRFENDSIFADLYLDESLFPEWSIMEPMFLSNTVDRWGLSVVGRVKKDKNDLKEVTRVLSVDLVHYPAAYGSILRKKENFDQTQDEKSTQVKKSLSEESMQSDHEKAQSNLSSKCKDGTVIKHFCLEDSSVDDRDVSFSNKPGMDSSGGNMEKEQVKTIVEETTERRDDKMKKDSSIDKEQVNPVVNTAEEVADNVDKLVANDKSLEVDVSLKGTATVKRKNASEEKIKEPEEEPAVQVEKAVVLNRNVSKETVYKDEVSKQVEKAMTHLPSLKSCDSYTSGKKHQWAKDMAINCNLAYQGPPMVDRSYAVNDPDFIKSLAKLLNDNIKAVAHDGEFKLETELDKLTKFETVNAQALIDRPMYVTLPPVLSRTTQAQDLFKDNVKTKVTHLTGYNALGSQRLVADNRAILFTLSQNDYFALQHLFSATDNVFESEVMRLVLSSLLAERNFSAEAHLHKLLFNQDTKLYIGQGETAGSNKEVPMWHKTNSEDLAQFELNNPNWIDITVSDGDWNNRIRQCFINMLHYLKFRPNKDLSLIVPSRMQAAIQYAITANHSYDMSGALAVVFDTASIYGYNEGLANEIAANTATADRFPIFVVDNKTAKLFACRQTAESVLVRNVDLIESVRDADLTTGPAVAGASRTVLQGALVQMRHYYLNGVWNVMRFDLNIGARTRAAARE